jgi:hypothetical protein
MKDTVYDVLAKLGVGKQAPVPEAGPEVVDAIGYLQSIYRGAVVADLPRMRAAIACLPYEVPKLGVSVNFSVGLGGRMEKLMAAKGMSQVIDGHSERSVASPEPSTTEAVRSGPTIEPAEGTSREP